MTLRAGVIGHPIGHSLSPAIHRAWLYAAGVDGSYEPILSPLDEFAETLADLRGHGVVGVNVTIQFKEQALALADVASARARLSGAANLLTFTGGEVFADNTDGVGLLQALAEQAPAFTPKQAVVTLLGAGGAARGAAAALISAGAAEVRLVNRTIATARDLASELGGQARAFTWDEVDEALAGAGLLINATSLGLVGGEPLRLNLQLLPSDAVVMDMVYRPITTDLLAAAQASGRTAVDGLAMLIAQARPSFTAFFGVETPDIDVRAVAIAQMAR
jgi:shikimate dehydrogenase